MPEAGDTKRRLQSQTRSQVRDADASYGIATEKDVAFGDVGQNSVPPATAQVGSDASLQSATSRRLRYAETGQRSRLATNQPRLGRDWRRDAAVAAARYGHSHHETESQVHSSRYSANPNTSGTTANGHSQSASDRRFANRSTPPSSVQLGKPSTANAASQATPPVEFVPPRHKPQVQLPLTSQSSSRLSVGQTAHQISQSPQPIPTSHLGTDSAPSHHRERRPAVTGTHVGNASHSTQGREGRLSVVQPPNANRNTNPNRRRRPDSSPGAQSPRDRPTAPRRNPHPPFPVVKANRARQPRPHPVTGGLAVAKGRSRMRPLPSSNSRTFQILLYAVRLLVLGVGVSVIAGTLLSAWDPVTQYRQDSTLRAMSSQGGGVGSLGQAQAANQPVPAATPLPSILPTQEIISLKNQIQALVSANPGLTSEVFAMDLDDGSYVDINGSVPIPAASTIKVPVLVAFFQDVDAGKIKLDEALTMRPDLVVGESGEMQYKPAGSQFTALETATQMIVISDNTATEIMIDRLGGAAALNQRFKDWGLTGTVINNKLPDVAGTNTTTPKDLVMLMAKVGRGELVSLRSRDHILNIMQRTMTRSLLPAGVGEGAIVSNKTGNIGIMSGDVALVDLPNGKRYVISVLVKRPPDDGRSGELIVQTSQLAYQYFSKPLPLGTANSSTVTAASVSSSSVPTVSPSR